MKKLLIIILAFVSLGVNAQFIYNDGKSTAKADTIRAKASKIYITDQTAKKKGYIRVSNDTLYFGDVTGEKKVSQIGTGGSGLSLDDTTGGSGNQKLATTYGLSLKASVSSVSLITPDSIAYNTSFPFNKCLTYMYHELTANDSITINSTGAINQGGGQILFKNNGTYKPRLGAFSAVVGANNKYDLTGVYDNTKTYSLLTLIKIHGLYIVSILNF